MKLPRDVSGAHPNHDPLRIGTLAAIVADIAAHHGLARETLIERLFGR
jgi:hypothetical protein